MIEKNVNTDGIAIERDASDGKMCLTVHLDGDIYRMATFDSDDAAYMFGGLLECMLEDQYVDEVELINLDELGME